MKTRILNTLTCQPSYVRQSAAKMSLQQGLMDAVAGSQLAQGFLCRQHFAVRE
jgi:hypothetical protein